MPPEIAVYRIRQSRRDAEEVDCKSTIPGRRGGAPPVSPGPPPVRASPAGNASPLPVHVRMRDVVVALQSRARQAGKPRPRTPATRWRQSGQRSAPPVSASASRARCESCTLTMRCSHVPRRGRVPNPVAQAERRGIPTALDPFRNRVRFSAARPPAAISSAAVDAADDAQGKPAAALRSLESRR
jgi:hypothetical protein